MITVWEVYREDKDYYATGDELLNSFTNKEAAYYYRDLKEGEEAFESYFFPRKIYVIEGYIFDSILEVI